MQGSRFITLYNQLHIMLSWVYRNVFMSSPYIRKCTIPEYHFPMGTQMIKIKVYCFLSLATLGMGTSVGKWMEGLPNDYLWTPLSNMALCMYGYDPFEMDRFTKGKSDTGVKKRIFEPTKFTKERGFIPNDFFDYVNDINCDAHETTIVVDNIRDFMSATSGSNTLFESGSSKISRKVSIIPFLAPTGAQ